MTLLHDAAQWRFVDPQRLLFRAWDDDANVVCYDATSGDTHLLSPLAAAILSHLQRESALRLDAVVNHVAASLDVEADETLVLAIEEILSEFTERGVLAQI
jgi:PqqD family protein of HPr-rel-A system